MLECGYTSAVRAFDPLHAIQGGFVIGLWIKSFGRDRWASRNNVMTLQGPLEAFV